MRQIWFKLAFASMLVAPLMQCSDQSAAPNDEHQESSTAEWKPRIIQGFYPYYAQVEFPPNANDFHGFTHIGNAFIGATAQGKLKIPEGFESAHLVKAARDAGAKPLIAIGGGGQTRQTVEFAAMAGKAEARAEFIAQLRHFISRYGYQGVQIDWEFPVGRSGRRDLVLLMTDLRKGLGPKIQIDLLLPGMISSASWLDLDKVDSSVDYYYLMMYDFHGPWSQLSGSNAPLSAGPCDGVANITSQIKAFIDKGMSRQKIVIGLPFYGVGFDTNGLCKPFKKSSHKTYRELASLSDSVWEQQWQPQEQVPYMTKRDGTFLWSFDNQKSLSLKVEAVRQFDLAGVFIWELTQDIADGEHLLLPGILESLGVKDQRTNLATASGQH
ncbi:MAG: glycoside hydrolase family 18 protein [Phycisphaerales bacterium]|nr:glycoside hydrolase family 18 protein [Phycisphaerales bacterium]